MDVREQAKALWLQRSKRQSPLICSAEGFYQHVGECANDSIQMILCFCDTIKEFTQQALLFSPLADFELRYPGPRTPSQMRAYVDVLRRRFARHYINDYSVCELEKPVGPLRAAGKNAIAAAIAARLNPKKVTEEIYVKQKLAGMHEKEISPLMNQLLGVFRLTEMIAPVAAIDIAPGIPNTLTVSDALVGCILGIANQFGEGHVMAYYKCGGYDFVYDNNTGPIYFPWSIMFREIQTLVEEGMHEVRLHHVRLHFQLKTNKKSVRSFYPVYEVRDMSKDPHKGTYYTYIPHTHTLVTLRYEDADTGYTSAWVDGSILWFHDSTKFDTENKYLTFMLAPVYTIMPMPVQAIRIPLYARPGEANVFRTEKPMLGPVYEGAAASPPLGDEMGAVAPPPLELAPYESPPKGAAASPPLDLAPYESPPKGAAVSPPKEKRGTKRQRNMNAVSAAFISRRNIEEAARLGILPQKEKKQAVGGARKTRRKKRV